MRPTADYSPSVWGNHFISCPAKLRIDGTQIHEHLQNMKEKVRSLLQSQAEKSSQKLKMIDTIQRLGVSYHFENEIEMILQDMYKNISQYIDKDTDDLYTIALGFRLLRQHGYNISCDIFDKFREDKVNIKVALINDVTGMLSLYEASNLRIHGEDFLDQAIAFTTCDLKSSLSDMNLNLKEKVTHALNHPFHMGVRRIEARYNISMYSKEVCHDNLLRFAMLDFNVLQAKHVKELNHITEWWEKFDIVKTVPYARDRATEAYFWSLSSYFEPKYKIGREIQAKLVAIITIIDDTYDAYATVEELEPFTEAIQRCDISLIDSLPECMKVVCQATLDLFKEMELVTAEIGTSCYVQYVIREVQNVAQAYLVEAKWRDKGYIPTYEEYMKNGVINSYPFIGMASFLGLGNIATKEVFDWISNEDYPKIIRATSIFARLQNDLASHKFERKREHVVSAVECVMNEYGISEGEAYKLLSKNIENAWKDINEEFLKLNNFSRPILECILNYSRLIGLLYGNHQDRFTNSELLKDHIAALLMDPVSIEQDE